MTDLQCHPWRTCAPPCALPGGTPCSTRSPPRTASPRRPTTTTPVAPWRDPAAAAHLGAVHESLLADAGTRGGTGSFYTPAGARRLGARPRAPARAAAHRARPGVRHRQLPGRVAAPARPGGGRPRPRGRPRPGRGGDHPAAAAHRGAVGRPRPARAHDPRRRRARPAPRRRRSTSSSATRRSAAGCAAARRRPHEARARRRTPTPARCSCTTRSTWRAPEARSRWCSRCRCWPPGTLRRCATPSARGPCSPDFWSSTDAGVPRGPGADVRARAARRWRGRRRGRAGGRCPRGSGARSSRRRWASPRSRRAPRGVLGDLGPCTADFRDQYYGLAPVRARGRRRRAAGHLRADRPRPVPLGRASRRASPSRGDDAPTVDLEALHAEGSLSSWAGARLVPKVLVATQGRVIEAVVDETGDWLPSVPVVTLAVAPGRLWHALAVLLAPPVVALAAARYAGAALTTDADQAQRPPGRRAPAARRPRRLGRRRRRSRAPPSGPATPTGPTRSRPSPR